MQLTPKNGVTAPSLEITCGSNSVPSPEKSKAGAKTFDCMKLLGETSDPKMAQFSINEKIPNRSINTNIDAGSMRETFFEISKVFERVISSIGGKSSALARLLNVIVDLKPALSSTGIHGSVRLKPIDDGNTPDHAVPCGDNGTSRETDPNANIVKSS